MKTQPAAHGAPSHCLNCGAAVAYHYCAICGQETRPHVPSVIEFLHEFIAHYVALEGTLWRTLAALVVRPGLLTADYLAGRRARYLLPLRLYLTLSILFFALLKFVPAKLVDGDQVGDTSTAATPAQVTKPPEPGSIKLKSKLGEVNPNWAQRIQQISAMPEEDAAALLKNVFFTYVPYAMFLMMPVFALYLKLLYLGTGRRYGEHMLFALHTNGFAFLLLGLVWVAPSGWLTALLCIWLAAYLPLAMRRVYGGTRLVTWLRAALLMAAHLITLAAVIVVTMAGVVLGFS